MLGASSVVLCGALCGRSHALDNSSRALADVKYVPEEPHKALGYVSKYEIIETHPHDPRAFTQGLIFDNAGTMYESLGMYGHSGVRSVDVRTGSAHASTSMRFQNFGEGIAILGDGKADSKLIQLTWKEHRIFEYKLPSLQLIRDVPQTFGREGWGVAYDGKQLYVTDSTDMLFHVDATTYQMTRQMKVIDPKLGNKAIHGVNELEWVNGELWGNVYPLYQGKHSECIVRIDPETGLVRGWIDMHGLFAMQSSKVRGQPHNNVLNGIAYHKQTDRLYVTGKMWENMYQVKIVQAPELSTTEHINRVCSLG